MNLTVMEVCAVMTIGRLSDKPPRSKCTTCARRLMEPHLQPDIVVASKIPNKTNSTHFFIFLCSIQLTSTTIAERQPVSLHIDTLYYQIYSKTSTFYAPRVYSERPQNKPDTEKFKQLAA